MMMSFLLLLAPMLLLIKDFFASMVLTCLVFTFFSLALLKTVTMEFTQFIKLSEWFIGDEVMFWLFFITLLVLVTSMFIHCSSYPFNPFFYFSIFMLLGSGLLMFSTSDLLLMYIVYEFSLFPIIFIILKWGYYSDRSLSAMYMLLYTTVFSFPFILFVVYYFGAVGSMSMTFISLNPPFWLLCLMLLSFLVKLPMYGLHLWLPLAHVEAPTFGSMILAGILLKLGGFGLYRLLGVMSMGESFLSEYFWAYLLVSMVISSFVASTQSDFKCLVAHSSVVHMTFFILVLLSQNLLSQKAMLLIMVLHGVLSPALFLLVGLVYSLFTTRLLILMTSLYLVCPISISLISSLLFFMNIPLPPFPQFLSEVMSFMSCSFYSVAIYLFMFIYIFMGLLYNMTWFLPTTVLPSVSPSVGVYPPFHVIMLLFYSFYLVFILLFVGLF